MREVSKPKSRLQIHTGGTTPARPASVVGTDIGLNSIPIEGYATAETSTQSSAMQPEDNEEIRPKKRVKLNSDPSFPSSAAFDSSNSNDTFNYVPDAEFGEPKQLRLSITSSAHPHSTKKTDIRLENMPNEILDVISKKADFASLKALRLTCKTLLLSATRLLFEDVHVGLFLFSLEKLTKIAEHPEFSKYVTTLHVQAECLGKVDGEHGLSVWKKFARTGYGYSEEETERRFYERKRCRREQLDWCRPNGGYEGFKRAIPKLPRLQTIRVVRIRSTEGKAVLEDVYDQFDPRPGPKSSIIDCYEEWANPQAVCTVVSAIAARKGCAPISLEFPVDSHGELQEYFSDLVACRRPDLLSARDKMRLSIVGAAFTNLRALNVDLDCPVSDRAETTIRGLARFLRKNNVLESLTVTDDYDTEYLVPPYDRKRDFLLQLGKKTFPRLNALTISGITTSKSLVGFLSRHSATLESLIIRRTAIPLGHGMWPDTLEKVLSTTSVKRLQLESLTDHGHEDEELRTFFPDVDNTDAEVAARREVFGSLGTAQPGVEFFRRWLSALQPQANAHEDAMKFIEYPAPEKYLEEVWGRRASRPVWEDYENASEKIPRLTSLIEMDMFCDWLGSLEEGDPRRN